MICDCIAASKVMRIATYKSRICHAWQIMRQRGGAKLPPAKLRVRQRGGAKLLPAELRVRQRGGAKLPPAELRVRQRGGAKPPHAASWRRQVAPYSKQKTNTQLYSYICGRSLCDVACSCTIKIFGPFLVARKVLSQKVYKIYVLKYIYIYIGVVIGQHLKLDRLAHIHIYMFCVCKHICYIGGLI